MDTASKIEKILAEIETGERETGTFAQTMKIEEVLKILGKDPDLCRSQQGSSEVGTVHFNIDEMKRWKDLIEKDHNVIYDRPLAGGNKLKTTAKRAIRKAARFVVDPMRVDQNEFNLAVMSAINILYNGAVVANPQTVIEQLRELRRDINDNKRKTADIAERVLELDEKNKEIKKEIENVAAYLEEENQQLLDKIKELAEQREMIKKVSEKFDRQTETFARFLREQEKQRESSAMLPGTPSCAEPVQGQESGRPDPESKDTYAAIDYFDFENHFRGSREEIKAGQEVYAPYFEGRTNILDLGCGRGEFLEIMKEKEIPAKGVDLYPDYVYFCRLNGFDAIEGDAVEYLAGIENESLGGIFAAQLIEHLEVEQILSLCAEAYKKLQEGAFFIAETPNPTCLATYMNSFYLDPSHNKPVHPKTMEYYLRKAGFSEVEILFTEASRSGYRLPLLSGKGVDNLEEFNNGINLVTDLLFGSQDYAVIAKK